MSGTLVVTYPTEASGRGVGALCAVLSIGATYLIVRPLRDGHGRADDLSGIPGAERVGDGHALKRSMVMASPRNEGDYLRLVDFDALVSRQLREEAARRKEANAGRLARIAAEREGIIGNLGRLPDWCVAKAFSVGDHILSLAATDVPLKLTRSGTGGVPLRCLQPRLLARVANVLPRRNLIRCDVVAEWDARQCRVVMPRIAPSQLPQAPSGWFRCDGAEGFREFGRSRREMLDRLGELAGELGSIRARQGGFFQERRDRILGKIAELQAQPNQALCSTGNARPP